MIKEGLTKDCAGGAGKEETPWGFVKRRTCQGPVPKRGIEAMGGRGGQQGLLIWWRAQGGWPLEKRLNSRIPYQTDPYQKVTQSLSHLRSKASHGVSCYSESPPTCPAQTASSHIIGHGSLISSLLFSALSLRSACVGLGCSSSDTPQGLCSSLSPQHSSHKCPHGLLPHLHKGFVQKSLWEGLPGPPKVAIPLPMVPSDLLPLHTCLPFRRSFSGFLFISAPCPPPPYPTSKENKLKEGGLFSWFSPLYLWCLEHYLHRAGKLNIGVQWSQ